MSYIPKFSSLLNENVQQAKALLRKLSVSEDSDDYKKIRNMIKGHEGYTYWFCKLRFELNTSIDELENIWDHIRTKKNIIDEFSKNIVDIKNVEEFWDEYLKAEIKISAKEIYNKFPSEQKSFIDLKNMNDINLLNELNKHDSKSSIIRKISSFKTRNQLIEAINRVLSSKISNEFNTLKNDLLNQHCGIIYDSSIDSIIIAVVDYRQLRIFGSDTAWCIVRSESTFDSYNNSILSMQYIIFLLDESGVNSKIGVTVDEFGYKTAHDKNDGHIPKKNLESILEDRGCSMSNLLVDKNNIKFSMFSSIPVELLLQYGFTKEEILKHKYVFKARYNNTSAKYNDLDQFTKEEIENYNLLEKTELTITSLNKYSVDEIMSKNLLNRVTSYTLTDICLLGFDISNIFKLDLNLQQSDKLFLDEIKRKKRDTIISIAKSSWLSPLKGDYSSEEASKYRLILIKLYNIKSDDISLSTLLGVEPNRNIVDNIIYYTEYLDYTMTKENINLLLNKYDKVDMIYQIYNYLKSKKLKIDVTLLVDIFKDDVDKSNYKLNYTTLSLYKNALPKDMYDYLYNSVRKNLLQNEYYISIKGSGYSSDVLANNTEKNLKFFNFTKNDFSLEEMVSIFGYINNIDKIKSLNKIIISMGYDVSTPIYYNALNKMKRDGYGMDNLKFYIFCIDNNIDKDNCYERLLNYVNGLTKPLSQWEKKDVDRILLNNPKYSEQIKEIENKSLINKALNVTIRTAKYWSPPSGDSSDSTTPEKWYNEYFNIVSNINFYSMDFKGRDMWKYVISTLVLLAKCNKMSDANKIKFNFISAKGNSWDKERTILTDISKLICNKHITNWSPTWRIGLIPSERKALYEWMKDYIEKGHFYEDMEDVIDYNMQVSYYLFDKPRLKEYINRIKKTKMNKENMTEDRKGNVKVTKETFRLWELKYLFAYLGEEGKFDDIKSIINEFTNLSGALKMGKIEKRKSKEMFDHLSLHFSRDNDVKDDVISSSGASNKHKKEINKILTELFTEKLLTWSSFNRI